MKKYITYKEILERLDKDKENWVCECGETCNPVSSGWRWNGENWEHHHGYPIGHVIVQRKKKGLDKPNG